MLLDLYRINEERSGENLRPSDLRPVRMFLESSKAVDRFDRQRKPPKRGLKFDTAAMLLCIMWMELKKTTIDGLITELEGDGGQNILRIFGMPMEN